MPFFYFQDCLTEMMHYKQVIEDFLLSNVVLFVIKVRYALHLRKITKCLQYVKTWKPSGMTMFTVRQAT